MVGCGGYDPGSIPAEFYEEGEKSELGEEEDEDLPGFHIEILDESMWGSVQYPPLFESEI